MSKTDYEKLEKSAPKDWQEVKLGEVAEINPYENIAKNIKAKKVLMKSLIPYRKKIYHYDSGTYNGGSKFKNGDSLIASITPCLENGKTGFVDFLNEDEIGFGSTEFIVIREKKNITSEHFLYYLSTSPEFRETAIKSMTGTSGRQRVQTNEIINYNFSLPPLPEQKAIAEVLSSLDDKIDLLQKQNQTLENIAQTLFRKYFIQDKKKDWEKVKLETVADIAIGRTPPRKEFHWFSKKASDWKWISIKDMGENNVYIFDTSEYLIQEAVENFNISIIPKNTVILSFKMTVGRVNITAIEMLSNEAIAHFQFNNKTPFNKEYLYLFLKNFNFNSLGSTSTIVTSINSAMIKEMLITIPDKKTMYNFNHQVELLFAKIQTNQTQIQTLENLRNSLLPKLISGKIRVGGL